jgi:hypothetical protein
MIGAARAARAVRFVRPLIGHKKLSKESVTYEAHRRWRSSGKGTESISK